MEISKLSQFIRSVIFVIFVDVWGVIIPLIFLVPALIFRSKSIGDRGAKIWAQVIFWILKKLCRLDYQIIGAKNISKDACIYACKHQSMWETIIMHLIINRPVYAYKKELEVIPFYGWFLKVMSGIKVDRRGGAKSLKSVINQAKFYLDKKQSIVIFPQGTRVPVGGDLQKYPYQAGITALYKACNVKVVPVALNSGYFWQKGKIFKRRGVVSIEFLPAIEMGLSKEDFNKELIFAIEHASTKLALKN